MERRWTGELACALQAATGLTNEQFAERLGVAVRTVSYWHSRPTCSPVPMAQDLLTTMLDRANDATRQRFAEATDRAGSDRGARRSGSVEEVMSAAVADAADDPILNGPRSDRESVDALRAEAIAIARAGNTKALDVFTAARRIREDARNLARQTRRVGDLADLYLVVGQTGALMASTAFDLGHWDTSAALARAAHKYAELAGHASLQAWTLGLSATLANWASEPDMALAYFEQGLRIAPAGQPRLRLRYIASRSFALTEDTHSVREVLAAAEDDRAAAESHPDQLSEEIGGEFAFGDARAAACAAASWLDLAKGEESERYALQALEHYHRLPAARRPYSQINGTTIDVATARLHMNDLDGARSALAGVFGLPAEKRNVSLSGRMAKAHKLLRASRDPEAQRLATEVEEWQTSNSAQPLQ
nr:hypothetical protein GCM10020063_001800 [Dactylosporangium thailandense]